MSQQQQINAQEWDNPDNWAGVSLFQAYFSKRDSRMFVLSRWGKITPNYGHRFSILLHSIALAVAFGVFMFTILAR
jgi:uncharacterized membrane protein